MLKVAIITIFNNLNYGNRLQNYAVQEVLKDIKTSPCTIINLAEYGSFRKKMNLTFNSNNKKKRKNDLVIEKEKRFIEFNNNFLNVLDIKINENNLNEKIHILKNFDYFIVGSDQVWNYNIKSLSELNFLPFENHEKKLAYAASLCLNKINRHCKEYYKKYLSNFKTITVREKKASHVLKKLLHKDISVVLEPVLMLERNHWEKIIKKPAILPSGNYILIYTLTDTINIKEKQIVEFASKNDLEVVRLNNLNDKKYFVTDPCEFLYLIKNSEFIVTDSYHAAIFAIIFNKKCKMYKRNGKYKEMNCRIETIVSILKFGKHVSFKNRLKYIEFHFHDDIFHTSKLKNEKKKAIDILKKSMDL